MFIQFLMFAFPIQVLTMSPYPSLIPYLFLLIPCYFVFRNGFKVRLNKYLRFSGINLFLFFYFLLFFLHSTYQMILGFGSVPQFVVSVLGYIVPSSMYFYFSKAGNKKEIKIVLVSIIICGLISGLYFAYDSYSMLILGKINDFSLQTVNYIKSRASTENVNISRGLKGYRSHGLLTSHSASAAWIAFSCFALLTLIPKKKILTRSITILFYGVILVICLNFTSIISFAIVIFFIEFDVLKFFDIKINKHLLIKFTSLLGLIAFAVFCVAVFSENLFREISESFTAQIRFLFGFDNYGRDYVFGLQLFTSLLGIFDKALDYPFILLIGDGFNASWGTPKGGDYGHAETLARFGIPFYCFIIIGFLKIMQVIIRNLRYLRKNRGDQTLLFPSFVVPYLFIAELHYSVWNLRSIFPLFFFSLALLSRNLYRQRQ